MADQEFLASFAVDIDEAGVARLQTILSENRELAEGVSAAFDAASESIRSFAEQMGLVSDFAAYTRGPSVMYSVPLCSGG